MNASWEPLLGAWGLDSLDALFADGLGERLDKSGLAGWRQRRRLTLTDAAGVMHTLYLKRFERPPPETCRKNLRACPEAQSIAGIEWIWLHRLSGSGIACPQAVALGEELHGRREIRSVLVSAAAPGQSLERWAAHGTPGDAPRVRRLLPPLARLIARFHSQGFAHRDLYLSHVYFDPAAPPDHAFCLIDLQRVLRRNRPLDRWIVKDLASLNFSTPAGIVTRTDRIRWLKLYLGSDKLDGPSRRLVYRVMGKTLRIARHDARRRPGQAATPHQ